MVADDNQHVPSTLMKWDSGVELKRDCRFRQSNRSVIANLGTWIQIGPKIRAQQYKLLRLGSQSQHTSQREDPCMWIKIKEIEELISTGVWICTYSIVRSMYILQEKN